MKGTLFRIYVGEAQRYHGVMLWEWLLEAARRLGIRGGSAFRTIGSFGRHHALHESRFFELAGSTGVEIEFLVDDEEMARLIDLLKKEGLSLFHAAIPATFGVIKPDSDNTRGPDG